MMIPIALSLLVSTIFRTQVFYSRYLLFGQLFFLAGLGLLISSVRRPWVRHLAGGLLLVLMLGWIFASSTKWTWNTTPVSAGRRPISKASARPGEPVVVCSQLFYLPLRYHVAVAANWYQFGNESKPGGLDAWTAMGADNVINSQELRATAARRVWVVNTSDDSPWHCPVPVPPHWLAVRHVIFTDTYNIKTDIVVVEYDTTGAAAGE